MDDSPTLIRYGRRISAILPDLDLSTLRLVQSGQNSDVLWIGSDLIARFPRYAGGVRQMEREFDLLRALGPQLPLAIPDPLLVRPGEPGEACMVYRAVPGIPLSAMPFNGQSGEDAAASALGAFLAALHGIPATAAPLGDRSEHWMQHWQDMYGRLRQTLFPHLSDRARAWTEQHFNAFLADPANRAIVPTVVHGDFGSSNILADAATGHITGVIDFSSVHLDDPAVDLAAASTITPHFLSRFASTYPDLARHLPRVAFYRGTFALQEALFGVENGDRDALAAGLAGVPPPPAWLSV